MPVDMEGLKALIMSQISRVQELMGIVNPRCTLAPSMEKNDDGSIDFNLIVVTLATSPIWPIDLHLEAAHQIPEVLDGFIKDLESPGGPVYRQRIIERFGPVTRKVVFGEAEKDGAPITRRMLPEDNGQLPE